MSDDRVRFIHGVEVEGWTASAAIIYDEKWRVEDGFLVFSTTNCSFKDELENSHLVKVPLSNIKSIVRNDR